MLEGMISFFKVFREKFYQLLPYRKDAAIELVDSLSSNMTARSVVELSLNPLHRRNYCSITRVLDECMSVNEEKEVQKKFLSLLCESCPELNNCFYHLFAVDCTSNPRVFSPTVEDRSFVYAPNTIADNKPITIGHQYSVVAYLPEKMDQSPPWIIPLSCERVTTNKRLYWLG